MSSEAKWQNGELHIEISLPETVVSVLPGKPLSEIVAHPCFGPETQIVAARNVKRLRWDAAGKRFTVNVLELRTNTPDLRINDFDEPLAKAA